MLGSTASRTTGLQAASRAYGALLDAWRLQLSPRDWSVLLDLMARRLEDELRRDATGQRRYVA